ncbi:MAG TPA: hypothetical protein VMP68_06115 [Candidatus Eisenbacteria bacterium]|nr:hypothetical protein [Candidatus Eisenbacteria bacterium]
MFPSIKENSIELRGSKFSVLSPQGVRLNGWELRFGEGRKLRLNCQRKAGDLSVSVITQTGSRIVNGRNMRGSNARLGINLAKPLLTLDVNGSKLVRGLFEMATTGYATSSKGFISNPLNIESSAFRDETVLT